LTLPLPEVRPSVRAPKQGKNQTRRNEQMKTIALTGVLADHVDAVNAFDTAAVVATFAEDAYINDAHREIRGTEAIRGFIEKEIVGDRVTMEVTEVIDHHGDTILRAAYDGDFDKTNLPDPVILTNYCSVRDGKIVSMVTILSKASDY
jgi:SnoaL-like domain